MLLRLLFIGLLILLYLPHAAADKLLTASKGKKEAVTPHYGQLTSFDGKALVFEELVPKISTSPPTAGDFLSPPQTIQTSYQVKDAKFVIILGARDPQEAVNGSHPEQSFHGKSTRDTGLQLAELQAAALQAKKNQELEKSHQQAIEFDMKNCPGPPIDQIVEVNPRVDGTTKAPIWGKLQNIANGIVTFTRESDSATVKYRLDELTEIRIGICR